MPQSYMGHRRLRKDFGRIPEIAEMPNLIEVQKNSYEHFLQRDIDSRTRGDFGLQEVFKSVFPIKDFSDTSSLEFVHYEFDEPKYDVEECQQRGITYAAPLKVTLRLIIWDVDEDTGMRSVRDIKEQEVYMGDMPLMTGHGTFVINGTERVIVSQMHRSPGVFFDHDRGKTHSSGKFLYAARIIPYRGSWLDFEFDAKDLVFVRIDRRRKLPVTVLLRALSMSSEDILSSFYETVRFTKSKKGWSAPFDIERVRGIKLLSDLTNAKTGKIVAEAGRRVTPRLAKKIEDSGMTEQLLPEEEVIGQYIAEDLINEQTGEIFAEAGDEITEEVLEAFDEASITDVPVLAIDHVNIGSYMRNTAAVDKSSNREEALTEIYKVMRPGEPPTEETAEKLFYDLVFGKAKLAQESVDVYAGPKKSGKAITELKRDAVGPVWILDQEGDWAQIIVPKAVRAAEIQGPVWIPQSDLIFLGSERYDLSAVGRVKMNMRLNINGADTMRVLRRQDILGVVKTLVGLKDGIGDIDDIDHLSNRRVRSVGELMENQYRIGLLRMERAIRERMSSVEIDNVMPHDLINAKPAAAAVREFFGSSQLSQFMDQTNPLSEITHKRRLSALGPGGLTRERAGFEVRDVHPSHYGRICPIETPEGPNIGLINSLATFARVNQYGFIESPYRKVEKGKLSSEVVYLSAMEEAKYTIAQANATTDAGGNFTESLVSCRHNGDFIVSAPENIEYVDVSPKQLVSVATALIPFLENDDANRALMGSNMQRQAVPLVRSEAPLVGTGMEEIVARDSGASIVAQQSGVVEQVDGARIVVRGEANGDSASAGVKIYNLLKFQRSNQNTCVTQRPLVRVGDRVKKGDIIADGPSTDHGELALGRNVLVAFMPWNGYNFEDSILISERLVEDDVFTSIHIDEFEVMARDTKLGQEEITRDIPNVGEEGLKNLDEAGIVYIGAEVSPGDILVGKITPKGESPMTPEEKLLRAIFGEKASDVRDTSLRVSPGGMGTVVEVRVFNRRGIDKDERALSIEHEEIEHLAKDRSDELEIIERNIYARLKELILGKIGASGPKEFGSNVKITDEVLDSLSRGLWWQIVLKNDAVMAEMETLKEELDRERLRIQSRFEGKVDKIQRGDELPPGVLKMVKVFVAVKRKLQPGDKMAGRHGNKGVISKILPVEDLPHLEDGTPVDIVLNPLGVPSRMNVGQILETHLGWASRGLGKQVEQMLSAVNAGESKEPLKKFLGDVYDDGEGAGKKLVDSMSSEQFTDFSVSLQAGVPMATPVFDGAHEADIVTLLEKAGLDSSGQVTLIDGQTGEEFARKVTVGYIYMLKLHHLVDDKIHARSIGPYSLVTQQPLGGKAQFGGQRFGEMEVWALQAYGASYTLQEMLTVKSDDVSGRTKVYESIVRGDENFEAGIPESFNVLVKEMQALGLDVDLRSSN
ncbi:MAG: DNA-directed RNA polymerase subunit beta [Rhodospirillaceae bacterium]|nr:DNA-directed RNA polymerase subunit beta [Rhodospirillaceae bacterium]